MENKRLTDIRKRIYNYELDYSRDEISKIICKLGQLEDLEEQIGCPLEKLSEKEYIYTNDWENVFRKYKIIGVNFKEKKIWFWDFCAPMYLEFKDYKKTWWLKEDRSE